MKLDELRRMMGRSKVEQWDLSGNWVEGHEAGRIVAECDYVDDAAPIVALVNAAPKLLAVAEAAKVASLIHHGGGCLYPGGEPCDCGLPELREALKALEEA